MVNFEQVAKVAKVERRKGNVELKGEVVGDYLQYLQSLLVLSLTAMTFSNKRAKIQFFLRNTTITREPSNSELASVFKKMEIY